MKNGFPDDLTKLTPEEDVLYASVPDADKMTLKTAFGGKVINLLETHKGALSANGLQVRDGQGELMRLVNMIVGET